MARERTCVACRQAGDDESLIRLVASPAGELVVDLRARLPGRGAWVHPVAVCVAKLVKRGDSLRRALRTPVRTDDLAHRLNAAVVRAAVDGVSLAAAAGALVSGHDALVRELTNHRVAAVILASDASSRTCDSLRASAGPDVSFVVLPRDRDALGDLVGRGPRAALGVTSSKAARHLRQQLRRLRQLG